MKTAGFFLVVAVILAYLVWRAPVKEFMFGASDLSALDAPSAVWTDLELMAQLERLIGRQDKVRSKLRDDLILCNISVDSFNTWKCKELKEIIKAVNAIYTQMGDFQKSLREGNFDQSSRELAQKSIGEANLNLDENEMFLKSGTWAARMEFLKM